MCPPGTYCLDGALSMTNCTPGTYNPSAGQGFCLPCEPGRLCAHPGMVTFTNCPPGHFCPLGSATPQPCPAGRYSAAVNLMEATECQPCGPGVYCGTEGLTAATANCSAGFLCVSGSAVPNPAADATGNGPCTAGHFCPAGALAPLPCPSGTFSSTTGLSKAEDCTPCTAGFYCTSVGLTAVEGQCLSRYYCPAGSSSPAGLPCPPGHFCPRQSALPRGCSDGTFQDQPAQADCRGCRPGYYCRYNATAELPCPLNHYCPADRKSVV